MVKELKRPDSIRAVCALAIFFFVFLGTEYLFDNCMASVTDSVGVVKAQNYVLGISTIGFCLYGILSKLLARLSKQRLGILILVTAAFLAICMVCIYRQDSYLSIMTAGMIWFFLIGIIGSAVHFRMGYAIENRCVLARMVGIAYALGILLQFINNNLVQTELTETVVLLVFLFLLLGFLFVARPEEEGIGETKCSKSNQTKGIHRSDAMSGVLLILTVFFIAFIFSTLDSIVTLAHADGAVDLGQWPRLLLGASGLLAGFLYDINNRRFMHVIMYCIAVLSTSCIVVIAFGGPFLLGLFVFYISAGFFSVYFTASFMDLSYKVEYPRFWAGLGRAVNNACAVVITLCFSQFFSHMHYGMIIVALILFVIISVCMFVMQGLENRALYGTGREELSAGLAPEASAAYNNGLNFVEISEESKLEMFVKNFAITKREEEVMQKLLSSDANVQDIARELGLSRAALYRHIANLNEKTNTKARIGLIQFYYEWTPEPQENA